MLLAFSGLRLKRRPRDLQSLHWDIHVPQTRISAIMAGERGITIDTGLRLDRYFGLSDGWWSRVQLDCDWRRAQRERGARIEREVKPREVAAA